MVKFTRKMSLTVLHSKANTKNGLLGYRELVSFPLCVQRNELVSFPLCLPS